MQVAMLPLDAGMPSIHGQNHVQPYFPPFNRGRININNNCCNGFAFPHGRQVNLSFWW